MLLLLLGLACPKAEWTPGVPGPPVTKRVDFRYTLHGDTWSDPYQWLEEGDAPEVQAWTRAQDAYARAGLAALPGRDRLAARFEALLRVDSVSPPIKRGGRWFYLRRRADRETAVLYVREGEGPERALLDPELWEGGAALGRWFPSGDGAWLAYTRHPDHGDEAWLHVREVATGRDLPERIAGARYAEVDWLPDGSGFYYEWVPTDPAIPADARAGYVEIRFHRLGTDPAADPVIHPRTGDPERFLSSSLSRDGRWHFLHVQHGWNTADLYVQDRAREGAGFEPVAVGRPYLYFPMVWRDQLYVYTNDGAPRFRVMTTPVTRIGREHWRELVAEDPVAALQDVALVGGRLVLSYLKDVRSELRLFELDGRPAGTVPLPGAGAAGPVLGREDDPEAFVSYSSFTLPPRVYALDVARGTTSIWAETRVPVDPASVRVEQVFYPSRDGTSIPMFLVHRKDLVKDGSNPTVLHGYGGFSVAMTPGFRAGIWPWLEAGGVYALANVRGGSEYGEAWHRDGMRDRKQNSFDDFIAAAEYLVAQRYTRPERLGILGGSNGGLLVAAAMTQRPERFGAVVCQAPLADMLRYPLSGSGRTWIPEYGDPARPADYAWLSTWSPYHRVQEGVDYPALLVTVAEHDDRVDPSHARKLVAAVQHATTGKGPVWLRVEAQAGHGGADRVQAAVASQVDTWAFLMHALGVRR